MIYRLVILQHLCEDSILMKNEHNQQLNETLWFKIQLAVKDQLKWLLVERDNFPNFDIFRKVFVFFMTFLTSLHRWNQ